MPLSLLCLLHFHLPRCDEVQRHGVLEIWVVFYVLTVFLVNPLIHVIVISLFYRKCLNFKLSGTSQKEGGVWGGRREKDVSFLLQVELCKNSKQRGLSVAPHPAPDPLLICIDRDRSCHSPAATDLHCHLPSYKKLGHNEEQNLRPKFPHNLQASEAYANEFQGLYYLVLIMLSPVRHMLWQLVPVQCLQVGLQICSCWHKLSIPRSENLAVSAC